MQALRLTFLLVALAVGYLLFFRSQPRTDSLPPADLSQSAQTAQVEPMASTARPHTPYKEALDRAHTVANQMQAQRKEADSY